MTYSTFSSSDHDATKEPMFFGRNVTVARYDQQKYAMFERLIEKQLSFFWRPEEVDLSQDRKDFAALPDHEQRIFIRNLQYQTLLDSVQGRSPNVAFLPIVSLPELETWVETWSFYETIHSRSYTHILRNLFPNPSPIFDEITRIPEIRDRARAVTEDYDALIAATNRGDVAAAKRLLYLTIMSVNVLEAIRFYVSFACSFAFGERSLMEGNAKIIKLIARDEALHLSGTQFMLNTMASGREGDEWVRIAEDCRDQSLEIFTGAAQQEKDWASYLFQDGSMIGLNDKILHQYIEHITNARMKSVGLPAAFEERSNPIPWISTWLTSDNVQVAPQETEISSYLVGQIDSAVDDGDFEGFDL